MTNRIDQRKEVFVDQEGNNVREVRVSEDRVAQQRELAGKLSRLVVLAAIAVEILIGLRVFLRMIAANPNNAFAALVYGLSELFVWPFTGITATPAAEGFVLDIPAMIAMVVYLAGAWLLSRLIWVILYRRRTSRLVTYERD
ncbi:MAG: YggT family protein [Anaerolineales bacterium]|nr:YggT family protein [Anaerolineales bacterium]